MNSDKKLIRFLNKAVDYKLSEWDVQCLANRLIKYKFNKFNKNIYKLLKARPFCKCSQTEKELYDAYCLRIIETLEDM